MLTDSALAAVIEATPLDAGATLDGQLEVAVVTLEKARAVLEAGKSACLVLPSVAEVASLVNCTECTTLITKASEQLSCQH